MPRETADPPHQWPLREKSTVEAIPVNLATFDPLIGLAMPRHPTNSARALLWTKLLAEICLGALICVLLIILINKNAANQKTTSRILDIYEKREDAGRAALEAEIDRLQLELEQPAPRPADRKKRIETMIENLKHKLDSSKDVESEVAGHNGYVLGRE